MRHGGIWLRSLCRRSARDLDPLPLLVFSSPTTVSSVIRQIGVVRVLLRPPCLASSRAVRVFSVDRIDLLRLWISVHCSCRGMEVKLVLWGQRAIEFGAELVFDNGHNTPVVGVFVGVLMESYNNDETLSGGAACRWYLNEEIPEIDSYFERLGNNFSKVQWISIVTEKFAASRNRGDLPHKTVAELRELDPWETEATDFLCTVTIANVAPEQPWWFQSCSKCHRSATSYGSEYKCSGACVSTKAYRKYRLCLIGTDGTGSAEFVFFNRVAQQLVGKTVMSLLRSSGLPRQIAAIV